MRKNRTSYTSKDSCPLASVACANLENEAFYTNPNSISICEKALCDQISRRISYDECCSILSANAHTISPASLVSKVLYAVDHHECDDLELSPKSIDTEHRKCRMWTPNEDILLLAAIHKYGLGDWKSISKFVGGDRSRSQCSQRWGRALDPRITKMPWSSEEEEKLCNLVDELGEHSWAQVAKRLGTRSDVQCRYRFYQIEKKKVSQTKPAIESPPPQSPPQVCSSIINPISDVVKVKELNLIPMPPFIRNPLCGQFLFDCPLTNTIPPLKPKVIRVSEPSSPLYVVC